MSKKVEELERVIENQKDYTIGLLYKALRSNGLDSNADINKQHEIIKEQERHRDRGGKFVNFSL